MFSNSKAIHYRSYKTAHCNYNHWVGLSYFCYLWCHCTAYPSKQVTHSISRWGEYHWEESGIAVPVNVAPPYHPKTGSCQDKRHHPGLRVSENWINDSCCKSHQKWERIRTVDAYLCSEHCPYAIGCKITTSKSKSVEEKVSSKVTNVEINSIIPQERYYPECYSYH